VAENLPLCELVLVRTSCTADEISPRMCLRGPIADEGSSITSTSRKACSEQTNDRGLTDLTQGTDRTALLCVELRSSFAPRLECCTS
jgi:hypothetical protein